jgi:valyl-tRNA synthetase
VAGVVPDARTICTAPLPLARGLGFRELATVVAADALVRRAWAVGRTTELVVPHLTGDLAGQYAFDQQLAREGHDRTTLPADELDARRVGFEEERRLAAAEVLSRLSVTADLGSRPTVGPGVSRAARTAFVRLFEEGLIEEAEHVVAHCPKCRTSVDAVDTVAAELEGERLRLALVTSSGDLLEIEVDHPELLPGAAAVAVPAGGTMAGSSVVIPIADREVPVLADALHDRPAIIVPAHDGDDHALARAHGLRVEAVLDGDGTVVAAGPLAGLGRYAARAAARGLLEAEGALAGAEVAPEAVWRCGCCGTVLVPQLGGHWFLRAGDLEVAAADAVRNGLVDFSPSDARDAFLGLAGVRRDWCLSTNVASGVAVPVGVCLDCRKSTVDVEVATSCGKCMGTLEAQELWLDARFVAAIWSVVAAGWPEGRVVPDGTLVVASAADLGGWVLPAMALGLRLAGAPPFASVVVHPWPAVDAPDAGPFVDGEIDPRVLRLALVAGTPDLGPALAAVAALDLPSADDVDQSESAEAVAQGIAELDAGSPAQAAGLLTSSLAAGVPAASADRLRALALPILGDGTR